MAERYSHGIRRVVRLGRRVQPEYALYHVYDLALLRASVAHNGLLYLERCVLIHRQPRVIAGQEYNSPALSHRDAGGDVGVEEQLLDGDHVRLQLADQVLHVGADLVEPF